MNEARFTEAVGDEARRNIDHALADVGMPTDARWVWATTRRYELGGEGFISGQLVVPAHIIGRNGLFPFWFATPYPWDKHHRNYSFELLGRQITSADEARQCPREMIWRMTVEDDPALGGPGTLELAVWRSLVIHRTARVFGRADWRPDWPDVAYGFGGVVPGGDNTTTAAENGLRLLRDIPLKDSPGPTPMSDEAAFEQAVTFGMEWLDRHPGTEPKDFGDQEFANARCTGMSGARTWMTTKHFGIKRVRIEMTRRIGP